MTFVISIVEHEVHVLWPRRQTGSTIEPYLPPTPISDRRIRRGWQSHRKQKTSVAVALDATASDVHPHPFIPLSALTPMLTDCCHPVFTLPSTNTEAICCYHQLFASLVLEN